MEISAMPFKYQTEVVTQKQFEDHMKLYQGYVAKTNEISRILKTNPAYADANATWSHYRGLKKGETYAIDGVIMHELYFQNLVREKLPVGKKTRYLFEQYFGGMEQWREDFTACAISARGWCAFVYEQRTETCRNILLDAHNEGQICTAYPLIILDLYEHAYFLDFGTDKSAYIRRFIECIPWGVIEKRASAVMR